MLLNKHLTTGVNQGLVLGLLFLLCIKADFLSRQLGFLSGAILEIADNEWSYELCQPHCLLFWWPYFNLLLPKRE